MWYALQLTVFFTVVFYYKTEIAPEALMGHIMLFAGLITFLVTKLLTVLLDALYRLIRLLTSVRAPSRRRSR